MATTSCSQSTDVVVPPLKVGDSFESYAELEEKIDNIIAQSAHPLRRYNSQSVEEYNRRREKAGSNVRISEDWKYAFISYRCVHYGTARKRSKGSRPNQRHYSLGCGAQLYVSFSMNMKKFVVQRCDFEHNHRIGNEIMAHYSSSRRLSDGEQVEVKELLSLAPKVKLLKQHLMNKFQKQITLKDIQNVRGKLKNKDRKGRNDAQVILDHLDEELQKDSDAKGGVLVNEENQLSVVYFCSSHMRELFEKFPEIVLIDGTYNVNKVGMPLYSFMVEDGYGHGRSAFYAATTEETGLHLSAIVKAFKDCNPSYSKIQVIVIDKDFTEISVLKSEFPDATILLCQFHVIKYLYKMVVDLDVSKESREELRRVLHNIVYSESEQQYCEIRAEIRQLSNDEFEKYFEENWDTCKPMWVSFERDQNVHFGNTTNNRLECCHSKLKDLMGRSSTLNEMFDGLLKFMQCIHEETTHQSFVEEFTIQSTEFDHVPGVKLMSALCTSYATQLLLKQIELARKVDYVHQGDGPSVTCSYKEKAYSVQMDQHTCTCSFRRTMCLPCRHIFSCRMRRELSIFEEAMVHKRWLKSYQSESVQKSNVIPSDNPCSEPQVSILPDQLPMRRTLSQPQKYRKMLEVSQKLAVRASTVGMAQFRKMYTQVSTLLQYWDENVDFSILPYSDIELDAAGFHEAHNAADFYFDDDEDPEDNSEEMELNFITNCTAHDQPVSDVTVVEHVTRDDQPVSDVTVVEHVTRDDQPVSDANVVQQFTTDGHPVPDENTDREPEPSVNNKSEVAEEVHSSTFTSDQAEKKLTLQRSLRENIVLKPTIKKRGRPKYSSKLWPSKQRKMKRQLATLNKENDSAISTESDHPTKRNEKKEKSTAANNYSATGKRKKRCGTCDGCTAKDCQKCVYCKDMIKYGGLGKRRKSCVQRQCVKISSNAERMVHQLTDVKINTLDPTDDDLPRDVLQSQLSWVDVSAPEWWVLPLETQRVVHGIWKKAMESKYGQMGLMYDNDVYSLFPGKWLSDQAVISFLQVSAKNVSKDGTLVHVMSPFLHKVMVKNELSANQWYKDIHLLDLDYLLFPICTCGHWILLVVHPKQGTIRVHDSINGRYPECVSRLKRWLSAKIGDSVMWIVTYAADDIENLPMQSNGSDCGVFVCMFALHEILKSKKYLFNPGNTDRIREWMLWQCRHVE